MKMQRFVLDSSGRNVQERGRYWYTTFLIYFRVFNLQYRGRNGDITFLTDFSVRKFQNSGGNEYVTFCNVLYRL